MPGGVALYRGEDGTEYWGINDSTGQWEPDTVVTKYYCVKPKSGSAKCGIQAGGKEKAGVLDGFVQGGPRIIGMVPINSTDYV